MDHKESVFASFDRQIAKRKEIKTTEYDLLIEWAKLQPTSSNKSLQFAFKHLKPTKNFCRKVSSYRLKHLVEKLSDEMGQHEYCGNLEFIIAACQHGFRLTQSSKNSSNYSFDLNFDLDLLADLFDNGNRVERAAEVKKLKNQMRRSDIKEYKEYFKDVIVRQHLSSLFVNDGCNRVIPVDHIPCIKLKSLVDKFYWHADKFPPNGVGCINREVFKEHFGCFSSYFTLEVEDITIQFIGKNQSKSYMHLPANINEAEALSTINKWLTFHLINKPRALPEEFWK